MKYDRKILLTPGPLTTSEEVKKEMNYDLGTRDKVLCKMFVKNFCV